MLGSASFLLQLHRYIFSISNIQVIGVLVLELPSKMPWKPDVPAALSEINNKIQKISKQIWVRDRELFARLPLSLSSSCSEGKLQLLSNVLDLPQGRPSLSSYEP